MNKDTLSMKDIFIAHCPISLLLYKAVALQTDSHMLSIIIMVILNMYALAS